MKKFRPKDKVYCPFIGDKVYELKRVSKKDYGLGIITDDEKLERISFNELGYIINSRCPMIFHATSENFETLSNLYDNIDFKEPIEMNNYYVRLYAEQKFKIIVFKGYTPPSDDEMKSLYDEFELQSIEQGYFLMNSEQIEQAKERGEL